MTENNSVETVVENEETSECGISVSSNFTYGYIESLVMEDVEARKLYINGEINETLMENITYYILKYNAVDKGIPVEKRQPILLYINSVGGSVLDAMSLISTMLISKTKIYTINLGYNLSCGFLISLAGSKRYAYKDSVYLSHDGSAGNYDNNAKILDWAKFLTMQNKRIKDYVMSRSNITSKKYDSLFREDYWFYGDTAKEYKFLDFIVGEDCDIDEIV